MRRPEVPEMAAMAVRSSSTGCLPSSDVWRLVMSEIEWVWDAGAYALSAYFDQFVPSNLMMSPVDGVVAETSARSSR